MMSYISNYFNNINKMLFFDDLTDNNGNNLLHILVKNNEIDIIKKLMTKSGFFDKIINSENKNKENALILCAKFNHNTLFDLLSSFGATINDISLFLTYSVEHNNKKLLDYAVNKFIDYKSIDEENLLHYFVDINDIELFTEYFPKIKHLSDHRNILGFSPLFKCAIRKNYKYVKIFFDNNIHVNNLNNEMQTLIHFSILIKDDELFDLCYNDIKGKNNKKYLRNKDINGNTLLFSSTINYDKCFKIHNEDNYIVNLMNDCLETCLWYCNLEVLKYYVSICDKLNLTYLNTKGDCLLTHFIINKEIDKAKFIVEKNCLIMPIKLSRITYLDDINYFDYHPNTEMPRFITNDNLRKKLIECSEEHEGDRLLIDYVYYLDLYQKISI